MKVVKIGSRQNMLQLHDGTEPSWYKVKDSDTELLEVVKTLNVNDEVNVKFDTANNIKVITELSKGSAPSAETEEVIDQPVEKEPDVEASTGLVGNKNNFEAPTEPKKYECENCGKSLKDDKYKTCYDCSMARRAAAGKSPEVQNDIKRQAIGHMTSRTLIALQGTSMVNSNLEETIEKIYRKYQQLVG